MPPGHVRRPPPLERAIDPVQSQTSHLPASSEQFAKKNATRASLHSASQLVPESSFTDELQSFISEIASQVSVQTPDHHASFRPSTTLDSSRSRLEGINMGATIGMRKNSGLERLLEPLIKNMPSKSQQPLAGLNSPSAPTLTTSHLALRNISGAYLIDAPCVSQPSPHFSISKSPIRSPRSLSPLAKTVERLSHATSLTDAAPSAALHVALPAILQQPIDEIRQAASACDVDIQSAIDKLQAALARTIVEAVVGHDRVSKSGKKAKPSKHHDSSKYAERSDASRLAMEDFGDLFHGHILPPDPAAAVQQMPRPTTSSSQHTPTPRSFSEGFSFAYELPLQSLSMSSSAQLLSREAAAECAYKKRMAGKVSQMSHNSIASMMSASGMFDAPASIWPTATLDTWPSKSSSRVVTSIGEGVVQFLQRESIVCDAADNTAQSPSQARTSRVEVLRQCSRRPVPQFLQKLETDLDSALIARGLTVDSSNGTTSTSADLSQLHSVAQRSLRATIFLDALALIGAAFPTYRGLIMRIHGELAASFTWLNALTKEMTLICEKFHHIQQIHADDLRRERERVMALTHADIDPSHSRNGLQISVKQQRDTAFALQSANAEYLAQRRVQELEKELETASDTITRLQEAVVYLRQQSESRSAAELQKQHEKAIAHLKSIIKDSVHRDDHNRLKQQLVQLQLENAQLHNQLSAEAKAGSQAADAIALHAQKNTWKVSKKNFGTQTFAEPSFKSGKYSLMDIKDMILGIMPGLRDDIDAFLKQFYGDEYVNSPSATPSAAQGSSSSPVASPSGSGAASPVSKGHARAAHLSFGSHVDGSNSDSDSAGLQQIFLLLKQSVDRMTLNANRSSSPESPSGQESKRTTSRSGVRQLKSRGQSIDEERTDVTVSERELFAFFQTNGTGKNVPVHLRTNIKLVKNRFFSKRESENMVHQIWKSKDKQRNSGPLDKFMLSFFIQQFGEEMVVMECTYSLVYALKKFKYDPDCDLFLGCLEKLLPQDLRAVQPIITNDVLASCRKRDLRVHKETFGYLSLDELLRALKDVKIFLYKSDEAFLALQLRMHLLWRRQTLRWSAVLENFLTQSSHLNIPKASTIMYEHLFESDAAGDQCKFAEAVREQSLFEYNELISDLQTSMILICNSSRRMTLSKEEMIAQQARHDEYGDGSGHGDAVALITMEMALSSWSAVDCRVPPKFAESVMLNIFQARTGQKFPRTPLPIFEVIQELRKVYITRYSKRDSVAPLATRKVSLPSISDIKSVFVKERSADDP